MRSAGRTSTSDASYADDDRTAGERGRARALRDRVMFIAPLRSRLRRRLRRVSTQAPSPAKPLADRCARGPPWAAASRQGRDVGKLMLKAANAHGERRTPGHRALSNDRHTATVRSCVRSQTLRRSRDRWGFRQGVVLTDENRRARRTAERWGQCLQRSVDCDRRPTGRARDIEVRNTFDVLDDQPHHRLRAGVRSTFVIHR
jgi:hypothetical protein